jgi:hypothetical protein
MLNDSLESIYNKKFVACVGTVPVFASRERQREKTAQDAVLPRPIFKYKLEALPFEPACLAMINDCLYL